VQINKKKNTSFVGNLSRLIVGGGVSSAIGLLIMPILTRVYLPSEFGVFSLFFSLAAILSVVSCLRYEITIVLPSEDEDAVNLMVLSLICASLFACFLFLLLFLFSDDLHFMPGLSVIGNWIYLLPIVVFFVGVSDIFSYWNTRNKFFSRIAYAQVVNQLSGGLLKLGLGLWMQPVALALIFSNVIGRIFSLFVYFFSLTKSDFGFIIEHSSIKSIVDVAIRYRDFPLFGSWSILLGVLSWQAPLFLLVHFHGLEVLGYYALAFSLMELPMRFLLGALGRVFYQQAADYKSKEQLAESIEGLLQHLVRSLLFPLLVFMFIGEDLFAVVFGESWREAGLYAEFMCLWMFFWFITAPFTKIFGILGKQKCQLWWNISNFLLRVSVLCLVGMYEDPRMTILALAIAGVVIYFSKIVMTLSIVDLKFTRLLVMIAREVAIFIPVGVVLVVLDGVVDYKFMKLGVGVLTLVMFGIYLAFRLYPKINYRSEVMND